ncbi:MAG: carbohydrate binding family 9 domain-containing protein, partial [Proteobacteria bacterium]|nr:carbohydrate binding family 9 domain-containing protein [Pseudomonadota bacterium]
MLLLWLTSLSLAQVRVEDTTPLTIDGQLDEPQWATAEAATQFTQFEPMDGGAPPGRTEVRFLQDERYLYVGIRVSEVDYPIRARISPREALNADDQVGIYLDTFGTQQGGFVFYFNPMGIQQDIRVTASSWSAAWDTVLKSRGHVIEDGYEIEVAIPWRSLKYHQDSSQWGLIITRKVPHLGAKYSYPDIERNHPRLFSQTVVLDNVKPAKKGSGLELIPTLTAAQQWTREDRDSPMEYHGFKPWYESIHPSIDGRFGVSPNIGVTAAIYPDFSQVEGDVTRIDLNQRFAFSYAERRPFFLEGSEYFKDMNNVLYTRSIVEPIWGIKVAGREGPWSVGVVQALDLSPSASVNEQETWGFMEEDVEDRRATNAMVRIRRDANTTGHVGITFTDKHILGTPKAPGAGGGYTGVGADTALPLGGRWFAQGSNFQSFTGDPGDLHWGMESLALIERRPGVGTGFKALLIDRSADYRKETGFLTQAGATYGEVEVDHNFNVGRPLVDVWVPKFDIEIYEERNGDHSRKMELEHKLIKNKQNK